VNLKAPGRWYHGLTAKQRRFVEEYPADFNATAAAKRAGYSERSAHVTGHDLLHENPKVQKAIAKRMDELSMPSDEALYRLSRIARGDIANLIVVEEDGSWKLDLKKAVEEGHTQLIHEIGYDAKGRIKLKLYSAHEAARDIAKIRGLFVERIGGPDGEPLTIQIVRE
jgi:phage terminase small subunit